MALSINCEMERARSVCSPWVEGDHLGAVQGVQRARHADRCELAAASASREQGQLTWSQLQAGTQPAACPSLSLFHVFLLLFLLCMYKGAALPKEAKNG
jgi:hypothetical protein